MQVYVETSMNAPAGAVWEVWARQFDTIAEWASVVDESRALVRDELPAEARVDERGPVVGRETVTRVLRAKEYFTNYDEAGLTYTFATADLPKMISHALHTSTVVPTGDGSSRLVTDVTMDLWGPFKLLGGLMKKRFGAMMAGMHGELKAIVEASARAV